jgi:hypothetical protein
MPRFICILSKSFGTPNERVRADARAYARKQTSLRWFCKSDEMRYYIRSCMLWYSVIRCREVFRLLVGLIKAILSIPVFNRPLRVYYTLFRKASCFLLAVHDISRASSMLFRSLIFIIGLKDALWWHVPDDLWGVECKRNSACTTCPTLNFRRDRFVVREW